MLQKAAWIKCEGEAHSNPMIDHCGICMPYWAEFPVCPSCGEKLRRTKSGIKGKCDLCKKFYSITDRNIRTSTEKPKLLNEKEVRLLALLGNIENIEVELGKLKNRVLALAKE